MNKAEYLQSRNPGVPEVIYKLEKESDELRKLDDVRELCSLLAEVANIPLKDIYSGNIIEKGRLSIDHFVPRSFVAHDELWNLIPMDKYLNSQKSNRLPSWRFFTSLADYHYMIYKNVFPSRDSLRNEVIIQAFEKCRDHNLNSLASEKLFIPGYKEKEFKNRLEEFLLPVYRTAEMMGYEPWIPKLHGTVK